MNNEEQKVFFRQCIYKALIKLMKMKKFNEISISEICSVAGVSRMTYYRNYKNKEDILIEYLDEAFQRYYMELSKKTPLCNHDFAISFFNYVYEGRDYFEAVVNAGLSSFFLDKFCTYIDELLSLIEIKPSEYMNSFISGGLYKILVQWLNNGLDKTPEEMAGILDQIFGYMGL